MLPQAVRAFPEPVAAAPPQARAWARLIGRIYEVDPLRCRHCGGTMQLVAWIVEPAVIVRILDHLGEPSRAPRRAAIRGPSWAGEMLGGTDISHCHPHALEPAVDPMPDDENQRQDLSW